MAEFKVLSPNGILGYGFPEESFLNGVAKRPDVFAADAGSTDPGPYYLGAGKSFTNRAFVKRDLRFLLVNGVKLGVPVVVGTAGGSGARPHLEWCREILMEIAREEKLSFKLAVIPTDVDKETVKRAIRAGKIGRMSFEGELTEEAVDASTNLVAQAGYEPMIAALKAGCNVILAGRAYDPANFAAVPIMRGFNEAYALHMGKILECGAIAATPGSGADCAFGTIVDDGFILEALSPKRKFTKESASAHTLYEKTDPYHLPGPGGTLDLTKCAFEEIGEGRVKVTGTVHVPTPKYYLKLEGARRTGFRTVSIAGTRDPIMIGQIDGILDAVRAQVVSMSGGKIDGRISFKVYGKNGVMGPNEPLKDAVSHELGIVIEGIAPTQDGADTLVSVTRSTLLHYGYPGRVATAGNLAFPYSPSDIRTGEVYEFSVYHLMEIDGDPAKLFPFEAVNVEKGEVRK